MSGDQRLQVVLCWHMHQPQYRDLVRGEYQRSWTYLHAIKDYVDMAAHLEGLPEARAVVNFSPVLLEQITDYAAQVRGFFTDSVPIRDPLLAALYNPVLPVEPEARLALMRHCLQANRARLIERFPSYLGLADMAGWLQQHPDFMMYIDDQFLADLLTWYHIAWLGETVRRQDARIKRLMDQGQGYSLDDRRELLQVIGELLAGIAGRYAKLAEMKRVELSVSPYAHPIVPLLLDLQSAREAMPQVQLPLLAQYPGGHERARWHLEQGIKTFERCFGIHPRGCWPSEGGISAPTLVLLEEMGFRWAASGEAVLNHSLAVAPKLQGLTRAQTHYHPCRVQQGKLACFFRNDGLSDMIGFSYSSWHADDAVANLVHHLENVARECQGRKGSVVSIVLDGENAWEYYPENGYYFLSALYRRLCENPRLRLTTFSEVLDRRAPLLTLPKLVSGSWVYGTFSTWIGDPDKNHGWDLLGEAKRTFDEVMASGKLTRAQAELAERQLAICEGSDWFWWFGDYNPEATVSDFERLFRLHLSNLYQMLGRTPPQDLTQVISHGKGRPDLGGVMRPAQS